MPFEQEDVLRLDVPVDDTAAVGKVERLCHLAHDARRLLETERAFALDARPQRLAGDVRHHEVGLVWRMGIALDGARVQEGQDLGMREARDHLDLPQESLDGKLRSEVWQEHLDGDVSAVPFVVRQVDARHPASTDLALDAIAARQRCGQAVRDGHESPGVCARGTGAH